MSDLQLRLGLHCRDAHELSGLLTVSSPAVSTTITSPPYYDAIDYGEDRQIGFGQSFEDYCHSISSILSMLAQHTLSSGSLWLVVDSIRTTRDGVSRVLDLPGEMAAMAGEAGWIHQDTLIWRKDRTLPWTSPGRLRNQFETILFFSKSTNFKYDVDGLRGVEAVEDYWIRYPERYNPKGTPPGNVWDIGIPRQGSWSNGDRRHHCPLPFDLVRRMLSLTTDAGDLVVDPFAGIGSVAVVAEAMKRRFLGTEVVQEFVDVYEASRGSATAEVGAEVPASNERLIWKLRVLKLGKLLVSAARLEVPENLNICYVLVDSLAFGEGRVGARYFVRCSRAQHELLRRSLAKTLRKPPFSKFGVDAEVCLVDEDEPISDGRDYYLYTDGRTWLASEALTAEVARARVARSGGGRFPPILSTACVRVG